MFALAAAIIFLLRSFGAIDNTDDFDWQPLAHALLAAEIFLLALGRSPWPWLRRQ